MAAKHTLAISIFVCLLAQGCAQVTKTDMDGVSWPLESCRSVEGTYRDDRDWGLRACGERLSLWEFLTLKWEADGSDTCADRTVTIRNCRTDGFDITLSGPNTPAEHAHVVANYHDGYYHLPDTRNFIAAWFGLPKTVASGLGRSRADGGLVVLSDRDNRWVGCCFAPADVPAAPPPSVAQIIAAPDVGSAAR